MRLATMEKMNNCRMCGICHNVEVRTRSEVRLHDLAPLSWLRSNHVPREVRPRSSLDRASKILSERALRKISAIGVPEALVHPDINDSDRHVAIGHLRQSTLPLSYAPTRIHMEHSVCALWTACTGITSPVLRLYPPLMVEQDEVGWFHPATIVFCDPLIAIALVSQHTLSTEASSQANWWL